MSDNLKDIESKLADLEKEASRCDYGEPPPHPLLSLVLELAREVIKLRDRLLSSLLA